MSNGNPTPEDLDKLTDAVMGKVWCSKCATEFPKFTALVEHKKKTGH